MKYTLNKPRRIETRVASDAKENPALYQIGLDKNVITLHWCQVIDCMNLQQFSLIKINITPEGSMQRSRAHLVVL